MEKYIRISNSSDKVSRLALEKLGLSTKRNDPDTIGQFGSGIKYAPIAALRMGLDWTFVGEEDKGKYQLKYTVQQEDGIDCIAYDYGTYQKSSSFTVDAGILSWEEPFQIYREAVANAMDEAITTSGDWDVTIVNSIEHIDGEFAVYITASPAMLNIYNDHDMYFLDNRTCIYTSNTSAKVGFYDPYENQGMLVYCKSVLVFDNKDDDDNTKSLFNYEINSLILNEMRTVADKWTMDTRIIHAIVTCENEDVVTKFISNCNKQDDYYELQFDAMTTLSYHDSSRVWKDVWDRMYGSDCIALTSDQYINAVYTTYIKEKGYTYRLVSSDFVYSILEDANVKTIKTIADEAIDYDIDNDITKYPNLVKALNIAARFEPGILKMNTPIACFKAKTRKTLLGITINSGAENARILIEENHAKNSDVEKIVATIIHEYDHYSTGLPDGDICGRDFRDLADNRIGELMTNMYRPDLVSLDIDFERIVIDIKNVSELGGLSYKIIPAFSNGDYLMSLGNYAFRLKTADTITESLSGNAMISEGGSYFAINIRGIKQISMLS